MMRIYKRYVRSFDIRDRDTPTTVEDVSIAKPKKPERMNLRIKVLSMAE